MLELGTELSAAHSPPCARMEGRLKGPSWQGQGHDVACGLACDS